MPPINANSGLAHKYQMLCAVSAPNFGSLLQDAYNAILRSRKGPLKNLQQMARCRSEPPESAIAFRKFLLQVGEIPVIADFG